MNFANQPPLRTNWLWPAQNTTPQVPQNLLRPTWKGYGQLGALGECGPGSNCGCTTCGGGNVLTSALAGLGRRQLRRSMLGQVDEQVLTELYVGTPRWLWIMWGLASLAGGAAGAYHGYKRWDSIWGALGWALLGNLFWPVAIPVAFAQGFAEPRK